MAAQLIIHVDYGWHSQVQRCMLATAKNISWLRKFHDSKQDHVQQTSPCSITTKFVVQTACSPAVTLQWGCLLCMQAGFCGSCLIVTAGSLPLHYLKCPHLSLTGKHNSFSQLAACAWPVQCCTTRLSIDDAGSSPCQAWGCSLLAKLLHPVSFSAAQSSTAICFLICRAFAECLYLHDTKVSASI